MMNSWISDLRFQMNNAPHALRGVTIKLRIGCLSEWVEEGAIRAHLAATNACPWMALSLLDSVVELRSLPGLAPVVPVAAGSSKPNVQIAVKAN